MSGVEDASEGTTLYMITTLSVSTPPGVSVTPSRFYRADRADAIALAERWGVYAYVQEFRGGTVIHEKGAPVPDDTAPDN
jgi:hypothetical protein